MEEKVKKTRATKRPKTEAPVVADERVFATPKELAALPLDKILTSDGFGVRTAINYEQLYNSTLELIRGYNGSNVHLKDMRNNIITRKKVMTINEMRFILSNIDFEPVTQFHNNAIFYISDDFSSLIEEQYPNVLRGGGLVPIDEKIRKIQVISLNCTYNGMYGITYRFRKDMTPVTNMIPVDWVYMNPELTMPGLFPLVSEETYNASNSKYKYIYDRLTIGSGREIKEHQKLGVEFLLKSKKCILADGMGLGKAQSNDTIIPLSNGTFKRLGDIQVGDKVLSSENKPCNVIGVYPQGVDRIYHIRLSNGLYVNSTLSHIWYVKNSVDGKFEAKTLEEILGDKVPVDTKSPVFLSQDVYLPIVKRRYDNLSSVADEGDIDCHLNLLGKWNADVSNYSLERQYGEWLGKIFLDTNLFSSKYTPFVDVSDEYHQQFISLYLGGEVSSIRDIRIPDIVYQLSNFKRMAIINGIFNILGTSNYTIHYGALYGLALDLSALCSSVGINTFLNERDCILDLDFGTTKDYYVLDNGYNVGTTKSKYNSDYLLRIVSVEEANITQTTCISVDSEDHSYLTENFVVTHNTLTATVSAIETNSDKTLIVTTASLKSTWKREVSYYIDPDKVSIITPKEIDDSGRFVIINYDLLRKYYEIPYDTYQVVNDKGETVTKKKRVRNKDTIEKALRNSPLYRNKYNCVIIDEAHKLSNNKSQRYVIIEDLLKRTKPEYVFLISGTPLTNRPMNLYHVMKLIGTDVTNNYYHFVHRYCDPKTFRLKNGKQITTTNGASNLEELRYRVQNYYIRRVPEDIPGMVNKQIEVMTYDLPEKLIPEYNSLWQNYVEQKFQEGITDVEEYRKLVEQSLFREFTAKHMTNNTIDIVDNIIDDPNEKVVIICTRQSEIDIFKEHYKAKAVVYNGKMSVDEKDKSEYEFMNNPKVQVFIGNIIACSVGLTLTSARTLIFNSFSYVPGDNFQAEDRIYRLTQKHNVLVIYQIFNEPYCLDVYDKVVEKSRIINTTIKKTNL